MTIIIEEVDGTKANMIITKIILIEADRGEIIIIIFRITNLIKKVLTNILQMKPVSLLRSLLTQKKETRKNKYLFKDRTN